MSKLVGIDRWIDAGTSTELSDRAGPVVATDLGASGRRRDDVELAPERAGLGAQPLLADLPGFETFDRALLRSRPLHHLSRAGTASTYPSIDGVAIVVACHLTDAGVIEVDMATVERWLSLPTEE
jgi:hypothetical protein